MGELGVAAEDRPRYLKDGFPLLTSEMTAKLDQLVKEIEARQITFKDWAMPGSNAVSAALDFSRTVCRRAERSVSALHQAADLQNAELLVYLNRLSDLLWLCARWTER
jgi:cob(I)alamin adenosyltransferase